MGFVNCQWRARGATNDVVAPYYRDRLMGDSPELMPLDSSLFGDLIEKVAWLVVTTANVTDGERYTMGTPDEAWRAMVTAWELVPEARIRQDVGRFRSAVETIIAVGGAYVKEIDLRNGHRKAMQRVVRGGALRDGNSGAKAAAEAKIDAWIQEAIATWKGISAKISASG